MNKASFGVMIVSLVGLPQLIHTPVQPPVPVQDVLPMQRGVISGQGYVSAYPNITTVRSKRAPVARAIPKKVSRVSRLYSFKAGAYRGLQRRDYRRFAWGNCTAFVAKYWPVTWGGNAGRWIANSKAQGYR